MYFSTDSIQVLTFWILSFMIVASESATCSPVCIFVVMRANDSPTTAQSSIVISPLTSFSYKIAPVFTFLIAITNSSADSFAASCISPFITAIGSTLL